MAKLIVIAGPMFSGKSDRLVDFLNHQVYAEQKILAIRPRVDNRTKESVIGSRSKNKDGDFTLNERFPAKTVGTKEELLKLLKETDFNTLGIDEAQFFESFLIDIIASLLDPNSKEIKSYTDDLEIYVAGLDMDYKRVPFGPMPNLMAMADEVIKTSTICFSCKRKQPRAVFTQRLGGSQEQIEIGNNERYQARCRNCHFIPQRP